MYDQTSLLGEPKDSHSLDHTFLTKCSIQVKIFLIAFKTQSFRFYAKLEDYEIQAKSNLSIFFKTKEKKS